MTGKAYITELAGFLPNDPVGNDSMEDFLGKVNGRPSRARTIVLKNNGIKTRHYALDREGNFTHTNAQMAAEAVRRLFSPSFGLEDVELLCCATTIADQLMPSHASMVHGCLGGKSIEIVSTAGVCCSGMHAMKYGMLSVLSGNTTSAVCAASELGSPMFIARLFQSEMADLARLEERPILAFEKDFLRWMLSDGAGAALIQSQPAKDRPSLRIEWIDVYSYAGEREVCMYSGAEKDGDGKMVSWKTLSPQEWLARSIFSLKQDISLLDKHVVKLGVKSLGESLRRHGAAPADVDYYLPHISSEYFRMPLHDAMAAEGIGIPQEKWFTNLSRVGNIGCVSIYLMLEELFHSGKLKAGDNVLCFIPESSRFSYAHMLLKVC
jgi:3-oxoacyl-[acyl-carrier-protein] synthase-3